MAERISEVVKLSGGIYMVNHITLEAASLMWAKMDEPQREEFEILYGEGNGESGMVSEMMECEHGAMLFHGAELFAILWAGWSEIEGGKLRTFGCVCTEHARRRWYSFARHSAEMREAFEMREPAEAQELNVAITASFTRSRNWAERCCGFKFVGELECNGKMFAFYKHNIGEV